MEPAGKIFYLRQNRRGILKILRKLLWYLNKNSLFYNNFSISVVVDVPSVLGSAGDKATIKITQKVWFDPQFCANLEVKYFFYDDFCSDLYRLPNILE